LCFAVCRDLGNTCVPALSTYLFLIIFLKPYKMAKYFCIVSILLLCSIFSISNSKPIEMNLKRRNKGHEIQVDSFTKKHIPIGVEHDEMVEAWLYGSINTTFEFYTGVGKYTYHNRTTQKHVCLSVFQIRNNLTKTRTLPVATEFLWLKNWRSR
jgi:hypothetical protein